jgi:hypothetical protein
MILMENDEITFYLCVYFVYLIFIFLLNFRCCCGQERALHPIVPGTEIGSPNDKWLPHKHTRAHPTDAYGTIEFQGGAHPTKAQVFLKQIP